MMAEPSEPRPEPVAEAIDPWRAQPTPQPEPTAKSAPESEPPSAFGGIISSLVAWFMQGNPLAKLGILLLFLGLSFLLRYTVEHALFPSNYVCSRRRCSRSSCWLSDGDCGISNRFTP